ncbi:MAG: HEAT repeat domain-containing protein [candidate division WOR-3 bacterium]
MDQGLIMELIKEVAVGFKAARSYPAGHPVFEKTVRDTFSVLTRIFAEYPRFSINISEDTVVVGDNRLEIGRNLALSSLVESVRKKGIKSIGFVSTTKQEDLVNLYTVMARPEREVEEAGGVENMLTQKGTTNIVINVAPAETTSEKTATEGAKTHEEIIEAIRGLMEIVRERPAVSDSRAPFAAVISDIEHVPRSDWRSYSEAIVGVVDLLPVEKRIALLQDVQMQPFILTMLSCLDTETLVELTANWERQGRRDNIVKLMGVIDKEKFGQVVPLLKNRQLNVYEYLTGAGINLLLEDQVAQTIDEDDLKIALQPYYNMLETPDEDSRAEALKSLIGFARRSLPEKKYEMVNNLVLRIALAIEQESSERLIIRFMEEIQDLYSLLSDTGQQGSCERLIETFSRVLGRANVSLDLRKKIIQFLKATKNPTVLPTLFSFLWESGLYPDVRAAIISFQGDAVGEAIQLLRDAEDFSVRMKLVDILKNIGAPSIQVLTSNLQAREWFLRRNIVRIFGEIGDPDYAPRLEPLLKDEDLRVRLELARTYGKLKYKDGLLKALRDMSPQVKGEALRGLKRLVDANEVLDLLPALTSTGDEVYIELIRIIDEKKIFEAINWIADLLKRLEWRGDAAANQIKESGVAALAKLDGNNAKMILLDLQRSKDKTLANLAANTLRRIG